MPVAKRKCPNHKSEGCNEYNKPEDGLLINDRLYCNMGCVLEYGIKNQAKGAKKKAQYEKKENNRKKKELKENDYKKQFRLTKKAAQKLANRLDAGKPCICCGRPWKQGSFCGGHCKSAGAHPELALDIRNIHGQENYHCNMQLSGNIHGVKDTHGFLEGVRARYGQGLLDYIEAYHPPKKRSCQELMEIRKIYNKEIRRIESGLPPSKDWRALDKQR